MNWDTLFLHYVIQEELLRHCSQVSKNFLDTVLTNNRIDKQKSCLAPLLLPCINPEIMLIGKDLSLLIPKVMSFNYSLKRP